MKIVTGIFLTALMVLLVGHIGLAVQREASIEKGKKIFNDPSLGTTGKSCNSCHPEGKGLKQAGSRPDLPDVINGCITIPLKGKAIDPKSAEMESLILYIKSFGAK